jgi:hypothetical protein
MIIYFKLFAILPTSILLSFCTQQEPAARSDYPITPVTFTDVILTDGFWQNGLRPTARLKSYSRVIIPGMAEVTLQLIRRRLHLHSAVLLLSCIIVNGQFPDFPPDDVTHMQDQNQML